MENNIRYSQQSTIPDLQQDIDADLIMSLPSDETQPSHNELRLVNTLFKNHKKTMDIIFEEAQDAILVGIIVVLILSVPQVDEYIKKFVPMSQKSDYVLVLAKGILAVAMFWITKHFYLSRKGS
jgi:hypothetical protein